jgi:hypothetical protein
MSELSGSSKEYGFSVSAGTVQDNNSGTLRAYLVLASSDMTKSALEIAIGNFDTSITESNAKYKDTNYVANTDVDVSATMSLSSEKGLNRLRVPRYLGIRSGESIRSLYTPVRGGSQLFDGHDNARRRVRQ